MKEQQIGYSHNEIDNTPFDENEVLFFPLPFNEEQKKVADILSKKGNCLLKGGPGTGKTQTLINLLANSVAKNENVLFSTKTKSSLLAFEELLPQSIKKYVLVLGEDTVVDDVRLKVKPYLKNVLELLDLTGSDPSFFDKDYLNLQEKFNLTNQKIVDVNKKIKDLLELNQQVMVLDGEPHTYQMAFDFLNNRKNYPTMTYSFTENDYNALIKINWVEFVSKINTLTKNELKYLEMGENLLTHTFMTYPELLMENYNELLKKQKKLKVVQESTLRDLNKKEFYSNVVQKFEELKSLMTKYNILLDEKIKQNFIMFFSRRKSLHLIEEPMNFLKDNIDNLVTNVSFDVTFPSKLHETEYLKDLEALSQGDDLDGVMSKITKKKQKEYFESVRVYGEPVPLSSKEMWKRIYEKVVLDIKVRQAIAKWNEHANTFGLPLMDLVQPVDIAFTNLKKNVDVFYLVATAYIQIEQLILPYMDLTGTAMENIATIQTYISTLNERDILNGRLQVAKAELSGFIQAKFLIPKNLAQAQEFLKNDDYESLSALFLKEIKEEDIYKPIKEAYVYIYNVLKEASRNGGENTTKFLNLILESGYGMKVEPRDFMNSVKKTLLNQFIKSLNNATILNNLMDEKKNHTKILKDIVEAMVHNRVQRNCVLRACSPEISAVLDTMRSLLLRLEMGRESKEINLNVLVLLKSIIKMLPAVALTNYKAFDYIPGTTEDFDLVLLDDASQEGFEFLPLVLKGKKVVVSGDERMYSPKQRYPVKNFDVFKSKYLLNVPIFLNEMITATSSLLDVSTSIFYQDKVVLSENFRTDPQIFEFVNDVFYEKSLVALKATDFLKEASLFDVYITQANYVNGVNDKEAEYIATEIVRLINHFETNGQLKSIGVISMNSQEQAEFIKERVRSVVNNEIYQKYKLFFGTPEETHGRERDISFISLGAVKDIPLKTTATDDLKLAMTRAKETVYLVRSIKASDLPVEHKGYKALFEFFQPKTEGIDINGVELVNQCKSEVEKNVMAYLIGREYNIKLGANFGKFSIDLLVYDEKSSLAIEIEGDVKEQGYFWKNSVKRQLELEEVGWNFYRVLYSQYCNNRSFLLDSIVKKIESVGIKPINSKDKLSQKRLKSIII